MKRLWRYALRCHFSQWQWARRAYGGKWEEWYADPVGMHVWLPVDDWHYAGDRPGGCAIWERNPKPRRREGYSLTASASQ